MMLADSALRQWVEDYFIPVLFMFMGIGTMLLGTLFIVTLATALWDHFRK